MRFISLLSAIIIMVFTSCNDQEQPKSVIIKSKAEQAAKPPVSSFLDNAGTTMITKLVTNYYGLKNALVAAKAADADSAALKLVVMSGLLLTYLKADTSHGIELKPYIDSIKAQSEIVFSLKDESCEKQRLAFGKISSSIYGLVKHAGLRNAGIYHQYCPMAFNEKGASWLSEDAEIRNPYFGKKMMECGEILDSL